MYKCSNDCKIITTIITLIKKHNNCKEKVPLLRITHHSKESNKKSAKDFIETLDKIYKNISSLNEIPHLKKAFDDMRIIGLNHFDCPSEEISTEGQPVKHIASRRPIPLPRRPIPLPRQQYAI